MINKLNKVRIRIDKILNKLESTTESLIKNSEAAVSQIKNQLGFATDGLIKPKPLAWMPPTLFCSSELGTTSDQCSSSCGVGRCSSRRPNSEDDNLIGDRDQPSPIPVPSMAFAGGNPF